MTDSKGNTISKHDVKKGDFWTIGQFDGQTKKRKGRRVSRTTTKRRRKE